MRYTRETANLQRDEDTERRLGSATTLHEMKEAERDRLLAIVKGTIEAVDMQLAIAATGEPTSLTEEEVASLESSRRFFLDAQAVVEAADPNVYHYDIARARVSSGRARRGLLRVLRLVSPYEKDSMPESGQQGSE